MTRFIAACICALVCLFATTGADARPRHKTYAAHPDCNVTMPCEGVAPSARGERVVKAMGGFGTARKVYTPRQFAKSAKMSGGAVTSRRVAAAHRPQTRSIAAPPPSYGAPSPSFASAIARPIRYIAGRLVCALNVGAALAERGIKGTGSALAKSYDRWGRPSAPVPGAVAVSDRRGGGHVAIVSRVEGGRVFVWNATGGRYGWREIEYTNRRARYRVAG
jgi:hypothetical protein